jgi:YegS/Rv2252/BmrU family lipid kinase
MRKAALLYNPDSGGSTRRRKELESVLALLRGAGVEVELIFNETRAEAGENAQQALQSGCDTIFACGGDGTIHNIVQVLARTDAALAILPMGTANALAHDLGLPRNLPAAAKVALEAKPRRIALGQLQYLNLKGNPKSRYFVVAAGIGVDAHLFYRLHTGAKQRMGMAAYYAKAWQLWFSYPMTRFLAEYVKSQSGEAEQASVTELMSVRIRNFGGVLQELAPGASLERSDLRVVLCHTSSRLAYLSYVTRGLLRRRWNVPGIELIDSSRVSCCLPPLEPGVNGDQPSPRKIYVEADGELLGTLPAELSVVPDALTVLAPS